ncbi:MAG: type III-B CRISPR module RAMP protein Cmr6, partial [Bacillota bacterium]
NQKDDAEEHRRKLVQQVADTPVPLEYRYWFDRWKRALLDAGAQLRKAEVVGRMVVGLGDESVLETSVTLHHTYGVPYIPGSALKGVAACFARQHLGNEWAPGAGAYKIVFGDTEAAGCVTFFDAFPVPSGGGEDRFLRPDVMTVHHPSYYRGQDAPPADWDSPIPIPFLSAIGTYLVALAGPPAWVDAAFQILEHTLAYLGVGAKTSSGYGRLRLEPRPRADEGPDKTDRLIKEIQGMKSARMPGSIRGYADQLRALDVGPAQKRRVAEAIVAKMREAGRESQFRSQGWYEELLEALRGGGERPEAGHNDKQRP